MSVTLIKRKQKIYIKPFNCLINTYEACCGTISRGNFERKFKCSSPQLVTEVEKIEHGFIFNVNDEDWHLRYTAIDFNRKVVPDL